MFPANVAVWGHDEIWMSVLRWVGGLPCEVCSLSLRWEEAALNIFTARQRAASFTSPLGMCANSKRLCLSTAIPKKQCQWNICKRGCFCVVEKSPRVPADLRATIKHQDFTVTGPQRSVEHQKKKKKVPRSQTGRQVKWQRSAEKRHVGEARRCAACLCQQKGLKYSTMNMRILCEVSDNKGPTASFLMTPERLHLHACLPIFFVLLRGGKKSKTADFIVAKTL